MLSVIATQNRNSPAQVIQKCAHRLIDGTQCLHCDRLDYYYYYYYYYYYDYYYYHCCCCCYTSCGCVTSYSWS